MKFANRAQLEEHAKSVHEKLKPFKCKICGNKFTRNSGLLWHIRTIHEKKKPFKCKICHSEFACKDYLEKHTNSVHDEKIEPLKCTLCNFKFASKQYLERHTIAVHEKKKPFKSTLCNVSFSSEKLKKQTVTVHEKKKLFNCPLCNGNFSFRTNLEEHITTVHEKNILLRLKDVLKRHIELVYEKQTVFTAIQHNSSVNESFMNTFNKPKKLKIELRDFDLRDDCQIDVLEAKKPENINGILETPFEDPFISEDKAMKSQTKQQIELRTNLEEHITTVHEENSSSQKNTLKRHDRCNICDASFYSKQSLNNHIKFVHEGKKPFKCNLCDASFPYKNALNGHIASVHERKKPFKCSISDYRSSQKPNMKKTHFKSS